MAKCKYCKSNLYSKVEKTSGECDGCYEEVSFADAYWDEN